MIEQYIYSRSKKKFINGRGEQVNLGFGFMAATPGLTDKAKDELLVFCGQYRNKDVKDQEGQLVPMCCKSTLRSGKAVVLQNNCYMVIEQRGTHVAHGYLLPWDSPVLVRPREWFGAEFWHTDPNLESPGDDETGKGILLDAVERLPGQLLPLQPLAKVMEQLELDEESFAALLRACFDAVCGQQQVQIAFDFALPQAQQLRNQVLCWIYQCLPFAVRRVMGFDAVCTEATATRQYQLTLVSKNNIQINGKKAYIRRGSLMAVGSNFLFAQGKLFHAAVPGKKEWTGGDSLFARWMDSLVHQLWQAESNFEPLLEQLEQVYALFDRLMASVPMESACDKDLFDALCWHYLADGNGTVEQMPHIPAVDDCVEYTPQEVARCQLILLALPGQQQAEEVGLSVLADLRESCRELNEETRSQALNLLEAAAKGPEKVARQALWMGADLLAREIADETGKPDGMLDKYKKAFSAENYVFVAEHGLAGPYRPEGAQPERQAQVLGAWVRRWLADCSSPAQTAVRCRECLYALPEISDQAMEAVGQTLAKCTGEWIGGRFCNVSVGELRTLTEYLAQLGTDRRDRLLQNIFQALLACAVRWYNNSNPEVSLRELEIIWQIFQPYMDNKQMLLCWQSLLQNRGELLAGRDRNGQFYADMHQQRTLERLRDLDRHIAGLPGSQPVMQALYHTALQALAENPAPFMDGEWLTRQAAMLQSAVPAADKRLLTLWETLGEFALSSRQDQQAMRRAYLVLDEQQQQMFRRMLPDMYLAGNLPRLSVGFVLLLLRMRQKDDPMPLLRQLAKQQGAEGVSKMVDWAQKYQHAMVLDGRPTTDLVYLLGLLAADDALWEELEKDVVKENDSFMLQLMRRCRQMEKQEDLDSGTADELVDSLLARFTRLHQSKKWFNSKKYNKEFQRNPAKAKERTVWRR